MKEKFDLVPKETRGNISGQSAENLIELKRVTPTNTLWFLPGAPMGCERQTAEIRNHTLTSMEENDIRSVAYRYLQNRRGESITRSEVIFYGIFSLSFIYFFMCYLPIYLVSCTQPKGQMQEDELYKIIQLMLVLPCFLCMAIFLNVPPNVCNTLRYRETKNSCEDWLTQKLGKEDFQKIEKLSYSRDSFFKINELLDKKEIPPALPKNVPSRYKWL